VEQKCIEMVPGGDSVTDRLHVMQSTTVVSRLVEAVKSTCLRSILKAWRIL